MNFKVKKRSFLDCLNLAARAISPNTPLPALSGIKITAETDRLILIASDSNISIQTSIIKNEDNLEIKEEGEVVIESRYLLEIVRKIEGEFIDFMIIDGSLVKISGGNSEFKINGFRASDYPNISFETGATPFTMNAGLFEHIVYQTAFACSDKETRPVLTGVNFKAQEGKLFVNATDSYRLASKTIDIDEGLNFNITIPAKYLNDICHCISGLDEVSIYIDNQKISFHFNDSIIQTRLLDDIFPDTSRLFPSVYSQKLVINSKDLLHAIDRSSFIKTDGKNNVKLTITSENVDISSSNQISSSFETIKVVSFEGDPFEISCSGKYLEDAIKTLGKDQVTISFSGELKPMVVSSPEDESILQLISPVRTYH